MARAGFASGSLTPTRVTKSVRATGHPNCPSTTDSASADCGSARLVRAWRSHHTRRLTIRQRSALAASVIVPRAPPLAARLVRTIFHRSALRIRIPVRRFVRHVAWYQVPTIHARNRRSQVRDFRHGQQDLDGADGPIGYSYPIFVVTGSLLRGTGASRAAGRHRHCHRSRRRRPHCVAAQRCVCAATRCAAGTPCSNGLCGLLHEWRTICSPYGATDGVSVDERFGGHGAGHLHVRNGRRAHAQQQPVAAARAPQCSDGRSLLLPVPRFAPARFGEGLSSRNGEPLSTAALAVVILHDRPGLGFAIGAPLIVAAVVTASLAKGRPQRRTAAPPVAP